jgi:plastocyanin
MPAMLRRGGTDHAASDEPLYMKQPRRPRTLFAAFTALVTLALVALTACSSSGESGSHAGKDVGGTVISLKSLMFHPSDLTVKVGTKVTWRNDEPITHTVTSGTVTGLDKSTGLRSGQKPDGVFNATLKGNGDTFSYTFTKAGTYGYFCSIHFGMNSKIIVTA